MKLVILFILIFGSAWGESVLTPSQSLKVNNFLDHFLKLSSKEMRQMPDGVFIGLDHTSFWGSTSRRDSRITLHSELFISSHELELTSTMVHEKSHQAYYLFKPHEEDLILEGSGLTAEYLFLTENGGKEKAFQSFMPLVQSLNINQQSLANFDVSPEKYGLAFLFYLYVYENFGQEDFSQINLRVNSKGISGLVEAAKMNKSFILTPKAWKSEAFFISTFYWSLLNKKNMIATRVNDRFTQVAQFLKTPKPEVIREEEVILPMGMGIFKASNCESQQFAVKSSGTLSVYVVDRVMKKTFVQNSFKMNKDDLVFVINTDNYEQLLSIECK